MSKPQYGMAVGYLIGVTAMGTAHALDSFIPCIVLGVAGLIIDTTWKDDTQ